jgi:hypothetical protein
MAVPTCGGGTLAMAPARRRPSRSLARAASQSAGTTAQAWPAASRSARGFSPLVPGVAGELAHGHRDCRIPG